ncbi:hypothetical protein GCM10007424_04820 [Flavobacterium suaedae]|uniref:DUF4249 domain-containing protein n=1 Tax=Flavobacterium suaedae TaxID=1767027 RepID=A0ABQ1JJX2_9FLAO|nr:DUF4249 domain-containing protein [Flavobacterium suaedae]GGB67869.1 hypothetical protein GCM10007424_04820 [Flavobacterium suaedae]
MKNIKYILLIITGIFFTACTDVVDVDLETGPTRLVVDAQLQWLKGTDGSEQVIKLSTTTGYYEQEIPVVTNATVFITNSEGTVFTFNENNGTGNYICNNFIPVIGEEYTLTVEYNEETYVGTETLYAVSEISEIVQDNEGGFGGDDIEVRIKWMDNPDEINYYMVRFDTDRLPYPDYDVMDDEFFQGNEMFTFIDDEDFEAGDVVDMKLYGISEQYFNYMMTLLGVTEGGGSPFQTPPVGVRGNMVNIDNEDNFPVGYFSITETDKTSYTIQ